MGLVSQVFATEAAAVAAAVDYGCRIGSQRRGAGCNLRRVGMGQVGSRHLAALDPHRGDRGHKTLHLGDDMCMI